LESKDQGKLERLLTNSLEKLFNLYGINDYDKIINEGVASTIKYISIINKVKAELPKE
jgi:hypothetical protein